MKKNKKEKIIYKEDDNRTIADMNVPGFKWHHKKNENNVGLTLTKKEKRALIKAALLSYLPMFLVIMLSFTLTFILLYFWLKS